MNSNEEKMNDLESHMESGIDLGFDLVNFDEEQLFEGLSSLNNDLFVPNEDGTTTFYQLKIKPVDNSPPTSLGSATITTRTNLKQILQMQQVQEQERREQEMTKQTRSSPAAAVTVPPTSIMAPRMDVPSEVLKVRSRLENPTHYHVMENRKRQVQEFLSITQGNGRSLIVQSIPNNGASASVPTAVVPVMQHLSSSAPSPDSPNSVALSSSATSASEADVIESIIQMESSRDAENSTFLQTSTMPADSNFLDVLNYGAVASPSSAKSCPTSGKQESFYFADGSLQAQSKDRQKKDNHNAIERRRRFNINDRIKELATLLPKSSDPYYNVVRIDRQNKGTILKASVDFIKELKREVDRLKIEATDKKRLEQENWKLRLHNQQLATLHTQSPGSDSPDLSYMLNAVALPKKEELIQVKEEPIDTMAEHDFLPEVLDDLMEDDRHQVNGDPMLPSPMGNDDVLLSDGMDFIS